MKTMLKKVLLLAFILGCGMQINALSKKEDEYSTYKEYSYVLLDDGTIKITRYNWSEEFIEIPESVDGYSVTSIGDMAFSFCEDLSSITLPDSIKEIGANPFCGCSSLKKINVSPDQPVLAIIDGLLYYKPDKQLVYCPTYKEKVTIPHGVQSIGDYAFRDCSNLSNITLPDSITSIGDRAFSFCKNLSSITLPDSITSIGDMAFYYCHSLSSITLSDSIKEIGANPFYGCSSLKEINVSPDHPVLAIIDGLLYYKPDKRLVYCSTHKEKITIPHGVQSIGDYAFYSCYNLSSITLPDSITSIGDGAFCYCSSLSSITLPDSIKEIGANPFLGCSSLKKINVSPDHPVLAIIDGLLYYKPDKWLVYCPTHKEKVTIPHGIQSIGDAAFSGCSSLSSITLPDSITSIGDEAFYGCDNLSSITLPDSITSIGDKAFFNCDNLSSITLPESITSIGDEAFSYCDNLSSITLPDSITSIGDKAFCYCDSLSSITLPDSITSIGDRAFGYCGNLSSIKLPDSITSIGDYAFYGCSRLTITVTRGSYAAQYCKRNSLQYMYTDSLDWLN